MPKAVLEYTIYDKTFHQSKKVHRKARVFLIGDREVELYPIRVLAEMIERTCQTVTIWERCGLFPKPMFKVPDGKCTRWYSRSQVLGVAKIYEKYGKKNRYFNKNAFLIEVRNQFYKFDFSEKGIS